MSNSFPHELLQAVSDWQRGGDHKQNKRRGEKLKQVCSSLPEKYRTCYLVCFRQIALPKDGVWSLIGEDRLPEKISSWTQASNIAKELKGGVPPKEQGSLGVILHMHPPPSSIIVNLRELYQDPGFRAALEQHKGSIAGYHDGAGRYGNDQSEVVLKVTSVKQEDIYSMGGYSSPFEELVDHAAKLVYGPNPTQKQRAELLLKAEHLRPEAGPGWLTPEATQRVVTDMKPSVEELRRIKEAQDRAKARD